MRQTRDRQCLQPNRSRTGKDGKEDAVASEDHVLDAWDCRDLKPDRALKRAHMARMHQQHLAGGKIFHDQFTGKLEPGSTVASDSLKQETAATEDPGDQRRLESGAGRGWRRG